MRRGLLLGVAFVFGGCVGATTESAAPIDRSAPGTWTVLAPMPTARQEVAAAALDGRVFVVGGLGPGGAPSAIVEAFDPATNRWETRAPLPAATHHAAAATLEGRLFVIGGFTGGRVSWTPVGTVYEYDPGRDSWSTRASLAAPRGALAVAALGGRLHALGGDSGDPTNAHEVYDPAANRWTSANPMPTARDHLAALAFQGRVWAIGGRRSFLGAQYANVEVYDPATDSWRTGTPLPTGRGGIAAVALADRIFVFGGEAPLRIFSATEMWDTGNGRWIAKAPLVTARHGLGAAVVGDTIYVSGGATRPGFARSDANEAYRP
ncbi:MAG: galactose oxidase [Candidatus Rokubacteria bacterium]|nr:galactose oxidase [Candidatus Rokubacteria bacterium]